MILKTNNAPSKAICAFVGDNAGEMRISSWQVVRYISEYRYFDAVVNEYPVTESEKIFGHATHITPGGRGSFHMDLRGSHDHWPHFLYHQTDLKIEAQQYMRKKKGLLLCVMQLYCCFDIS